jgi:hypothetical protein
MRGAVLFLGSLQLMAQCDDLNLALMLRYDSPISIELSDINLGSNIAEAA